VTEIPGRSGATEPTFPTANEVVDVEIKGACHGREVLGHGTDLDEVLERAFTRHEAFVDTHLCRDDVGSAGRSPIEGVHATLWDPVAITAMKRDSQ
jgi:hypothetical protein